MLDQLSIFYVLAFSISYDILTKPKAHQVSILKTYVASLVFSTHNDATYFVGLLLAYQMARRFHYAFDYFIRLIHRWIIGNHACVVLPLQCNSS